MTPLKLDEIWSLLPPLDELRPVMDLLAAEARPDPGHAWSGSGELDTAGSRVLDGSEVSEQADELVDRARDRLGRIFRGVGDALGALAREDRPGAAEAFLGVAAAEEEGDRPERADAWAHAAIRTLEAEPPSALRSRALRRRARALWTRGRLSQALELYRESHRMAVGLEDAAGAAEAAVGAGNVLEEQGLWDEAETWYRDALSVVEAESAGYDDPRPEELHAVFNLHVVTLSRGDLESSVAWLERARELAGQLRDAGAGPFLRNADGQLAMARREFTEAESHFRTGYALASGNRSRTVLGCNLAEALLAQGRYLDAASAAREAERDALVGGLMGRLPEVYRILGRIAADQGNPDAFVLFERALEIIRERDLPALEEARTLQAYASAEAARGEEDTATDLRKRAQSLYASLGIRHLRDPWTDLHRANGPQPT